MIQPSAIIYGALFATAFFLFCAALAGFMGWLETGPGYIDIFKSIQARRIVYNYDHDVLELWLQ